MQLFFRAYSAKVGRACRKAFLHDAVESLLEKAVGEYCDG